MQDILWYAYKINDAQRHYNLCVQGCVIYFFFIFIVYRNTPHIMIKNKLYFITSNDIQNSNNNSKYIVKFSFIFIFFFSFLIKQKCQGQTSVYSINFNKSIT